MKTLILFCLLCLFASVAWAQNHVYVIGNAPIKIEGAANLQKLKEAVQASVPRIQPATMTAYKVSQTFEDGAPTGQNFEAFYQEKGTRAEMIAFAKARNLPPKMGTDGADRTLPYMVPGALDATSRPPHKTFVKDVMGEATMDIVIAFHCAKDAAGDIWCRTYSLKVGNDEAVDGDQASEKFVRWARPQEIGTP